MVRVILIADMVGGVNQGMEGKRSKPYQQKDCCKLEHSISLKLNHNLPFDKPKDYILRDRLSIEKAPFDYNNAF